VLTVWQAVATALAQSSGRADRRMAKAVTDFVRAMPVVMQARDAMKLKVTNPQRPVRNDAVSSSAPAIRREIHAAS